jgi:hypothetical protein
LFLVSYSGWKIRYAISSVDIFVDVKPAISYQIASGECTYAYLSFLDVLATKSCSDAPMSFTTSVHSSTCYNSRTAEWIFMKFDIGEFY